MNTTPTPARRDPWRPRMGRWLRRHCPPRVRRVPAPIPTATRRRPLRPPVDRDSLAGSLAVAFPVASARAGMPRELWESALGPVPALAYGYDALHRQATPSTRTDAATRTPKTGRLAAAVVRSRAAHDAVGARLERRLRTAWQRTRPLDVHARRPKTTGTAPRPVVLSPAPEATRRSESHVGGCDCIACAFAPAFSEAYALRMSVSHSLGSFT